MLEVNAWLPLQDAFRTIDWVKIRKELEKLSFVQTKRPPFVFY